VPRAQDLGRHRGRGRLAVRCGYDRCPRFEARGEAVDRAAVEVGEELARNRRTTAGAEASRESGYAACGGNLEREWGAGAHPASVVQTRLHGTTCGFLNLLYTYWHG
jgi:hypothetical protein